MTARDDSRSPGESDVCLITPWPTEILAYAAGVIDSDGSIQIQRETYAARVLQVTTVATFSERVVLRQIEPQAVNLLHAWFGGHRSVIVAGRRRPEAQPLHSLHLVDRRAGLFLEVVLPYLRIKRRQAELCLEMRRLKERSRKARFAYGRGHRGGGRRPEAITVAMEAVHAQIAALNRVAGRSARFGPVSTETRDGCLGPTGALVVERNDSCDPSNSSFSQGAEAGAGGRPKDRGKKAQPSS